MGSLTYQLNPLIEAQKNFDVMETRLFYLGLQDINPHITENDKYYDTAFPDTLITPSELIKIFGHGQYIREVEKASDRLIGRYVSIHFNDGFDKYTIFQHIRYRDGKGLYIKFNEDMRPFILDIYKSYRKYGFTKIEMQQIFILDSAYAMRLLELLLKYRSTAKKNIIVKEFDIDELKNNLNVPKDAYRNRMSNFRTKVLDTPIKDINKNTKYCVTYEPIKNGRKVSGFRFICNCSNVVSDNEFTTTIDTDKMDKTSEEVDLMTKLTRYGFGKRVINKLVKICGSKEELSARLEFGEKRAREQKTDVGKLSGYLRTAIEHNWLKEQKDKEAVQQKELEASAVREAYEELALEMFSEEMPPDRPEIPFNLDNPIDSTLVKLIRKGIKERNLDFSAKERLKEHGMTVARFVELYGLN